MSVYNDFGIVPVINAWGTVTEIGGSLLDDRVVAAMADAAKSFVDVVALHRVGGERVASALGVEAALLTSGAAAAVTIAAAGCLTGTNRDAAARLPEDGSGAHEILILAAHDSDYTQQLRLTGAKVTLVGTPAAATADDVLAAIGPTTRAFFYLAEAEASGLCTLEELAAVLGDRNIPIIVDAAGELPMPGGLPRLFERGADLVVLSGGKEIRGPQASGVLAGSAALIEACALNAFPAPSIGRGMKLDKETIVGLVTAVSLYAERDEGAIAFHRLNLLDELEAGLQQRDDLELRRAYPVGRGLRPGTIPRLLLRPLVGTARDIQSLLRSGDRPVAVGLSDDQISLNPQCLRAEDVDVIVDQIGRVLDALALSAATPER